MSTPAKSVVEDSPPGVAAEQPPLRVPFSATIPDTPIVVSAMSMDTLQSAKSDLADRIQSLVTDAGNSVKHCIRGTNVQNELARMSKNLAQAEPDILSTGQSVRQMHISVNTLIGQAYEVERHMQAISSIIERADPSMWLVE
ncbi:hypothetical protein H696_05043 [Fonticula alba]|uniref:BLOC-1-related complex subunit 7 n=1 Tax=Fonticula alba TaxID=691883 RepID=A0A058Z383_FONAL|nr:hypothetical protein H696_05043 [Fonticula alba]KCV68759.1 hypothetical protein H696_05043 [Fonticula alba]|eukprot:XP_009497191.1 hypothetical protein H696_05043 [Fonticula alba]